MTSASKKELTPEKLHWYRLTLALDSTYKLRSLKARTGLTPNILCRIGLCLSLTEASIPDPNDYDEQGAELNRSTLFGEYDAVYEALLRERLNQDRLDVGEHMLPQLRAHVNRGAQLLSPRVKDLDDVIALVLDNQAPQERSGVAVAIDAGSTDVEFK